MVQPDMDQHGYDYAEDERLEPLIPFDVRDESGRRGMMILAGAIIGLLILATILFLTYQPGTRDRAEPPRISSDNAPFKVKPDNPGGTQTPNQDKSVYDVMAGNRVDENVVTKPIAETPIEMPKAANIIPAEPNVVPPKVVEPKPVVRQPVTPPVTVGGGDYVAQIASVRSRGAAMDIWNTVSNKHSSAIPRGLYSDVVNVDLGDKGIYYRLRIAGLADKSAAQALCSRLTARGQACFVTKR